MVKKKHQQHIKTLKKAFSAYAKDYTKLAYAHEHIKNKKGAKQRAHKTSKTHITKLAKHFKKLEKVLS